MNSKVDHAWNGLMMCYEEMAEHNPIKLVVPHDDNLRALSDGDECCYDYAKDRHMRKAKHIKIDLDHYTNLVNPSQWECAWNHFFDKISKYSRNNSTVTVLPGFSSGGCFHIHHTGISLDYDKGIISANVGILVNNDE